MQHTPLDANQMQNRIMVEQVAEAAVTKFALDNQHLFNIPKPPQPSEIPAPLKWAGGICAALFVTLSGAMVLWLVTSVSQMQVTLARMDERQSNQAALMLDWRNGIEVRIQKLESYQSGNDR